MKNLFFLIILSVATSCIGFKGNKIPAVSEQDLKPISTPRKIVRIFSAWESDSNIAKEKIAQAHKQMFNKAIVASECCVITEDKENADIVVDGRVHDNNATNPACLTFAMITGFSLYIIPSWCTANLQISAEVRNKKKHNSYHFQDSTTMAQWLPFIVAMPFRENPIKSEMNGNYNLHKNLLLQMRKDGILVNKK